MNSILNLKMVDISNLVIREIQEEEFGILEDLLYEAIFQPDTANPIPRSIIDTPEVRVYIKNFGQKKDDHCLVAILHEQIIGGVWVRILADDIRGFGNLDNKTPEFAISVFKEFQNQGVGKFLMKEMISCLKNKKYCRASLSVQKENYAFKMYKDFGFEILSENDEDYLMLLNLVTRYPTFTQNTKLLSRK